ncbi:dihydroxy-acid dehydratase, partial [Streptomyces sp. 4N509B]
NRRLDLDIPDTERATRAATHTPPPPHPAAAHATQRGWTRLYTQHVLQANEGADLDFLTGTSGHHIPRHSH